MTDIPTQALPRTATDSEFTSGAESGLSTRADPGSTLTQGMLGAARYPARYMNWILGGLGDWLSFLREAIPSRLTSTARSFPLDIAAAHMLTTDTALRAAPEAGVFGTFNVYQIVLTQTEDTAEFILDLGSLPRDGLLTEIMLRVYSTGTPTVMPCISLKALGDSGVVAHIAGPVYIDPAHWGAYIAYDLTLDLSAAPVDLNTEPLYGPASRYLLYLTGGQKSSWTDNMFYYGCRAKVVSKPWA